MISKIEMQAMDAVIGIHREMRKANEIDWEQRRYEIAKSMLPVVRSNSSGIMSIKQVARLAVDYAPEQSMKRMISVIKKKFLACEV